MKTLNMLVFVLVLLISTAANATLSMDVSGTVSVAQGDTLTITMSSSSSQLFGYYGIVIIEEGGAGVLSNIIDLPDAGNLATAGVYTEAGWGSGYWMQTGSTEGDLVAGAHYTVDWDTSSLAVGNTALVSLWLDPDYDTPQATALLEVVIPEPFTIALLGLGGLFLRRRK